jgi:KDO2-lipid IV(A) lauroyltransferase
MFYLIYGFLYLISLLPFWILYGISYLAYILIYYIIGYRKEVVMLNIALAFPERSLAERKLIAKNFYKNFTDNFIEIIKLLSISKKELRKRFAGEFDDVNKYYTTGKNIQLHAGHFFNWEYASLAFCIESVYQVLLVYMPVASKAMDKIFYKIRSRFGAKMIAATSFLKDFKPYSKVRFSLIMVGDQSAGNTETAYWFPFFGKLTPFVTGPEKSARLNNAIVLYGHYQKIKRGYYYLKFHVITEDPRSLKEGEITKRLINFVEDNIREQPEIYLWTHRRWKHEYDPSKHRAL